MMRECTPMQAKMAPLIITERRIIIYLCSFMGGIIGLHCLSDSWLWGTELMQITGAAMRYGAALLPVRASHVPIHKYAAVVAISIGLI